MQVLRPCLLEEKMTVPTYAEADNLSNNLTRFLYHFGLVIAPSDAEVTREANFANAPLS